MQTFNPEAIAQELHQDADDSGLEVLENAASRFAEIFVTLMEMEGIQISEVRSDALFLETCNRLKANLD